MTVATWNIEAETGYKPITTFFEDFSIADWFGVSAIKDTYKNGLKTAEYMGYEYITEFVMALNWKIWQHYGRNNKYAEIYNDLWMKAVEYAETHLEGEELAYYYRTTD